MVVVRRVRHGPAEALGCASPPPRLGDPSASVRGPVGAHSQFLSCSSKQVACSSKQSRAATPAVAPTARPLRGFQGAPHLRRSLSGAGGAQHGELVLGAELHQARHRSKA